jgi:hypothetical protein
MKFSDRVRLQRAYTDQNASVKRGDLLAGPLGSPQYEPTKVKDVPRTPAEKFPRIAGLGKTIKSFFPSGVMPVERAKAIQPTPTPMYLMPKKPSERDRIKSAIDEGFKNWGSPPAATLSGEMADHAMKYPILRQNPFMLPALTLNETGGGEKTKRPNNFTNWGVYEKSFNPKTPAEAIERTASGIGERTPYYENFRKTGNLDDFSSVYAPDSDNPGTGGANYSRNLKKIMEVFKSKYK